MEKKYWLHRISHEWTISYPLLEQGYLSIGWNYLSKTNVINEIAKDGIDGFKKVIESAGIQYRLVQNLWHFLNFKPGDIVVVPKFDKEFGVFEIQGMPFRVSDKPEICIKSTDGMQIKVGEDGFFSSKTGYIYDIGYLVPVKELNHIPRSYANADLVSRMKIRQSTANIGDISESVEVAITTKQPISLHDYILDKASDHALSALKQRLSPDNLEKVVRWYMIKMGASRSYIPAKNESGKENYADADVIAEFDDLGLVFYIQVKKHTGKTNEWSVHQISEYQQQMQDGSNDYTYVSWVISTAEFSELAKEDAKSKGVRLISGDDLVKMLLNCGIEDIDKALV